MITRKTAFRILLAFANWRNPKVMLWLLPKKWKPRRRWLNARLAEMVTKASLEILANRTKDFNFYKGERWGSCIGETINIRRPERFTS